MINLTAAAPKQTDSSVADATAASSNSPLSGGGGDPSGASGAGGGQVSGKRLFGAMLASAFGQPARSSVAGARGNGLPVPSLQEREVGAGIRLITAEGAERPGEDALFAFAIAQGLDASLVASVLWPGMVAQVAADGSGIAGSPEAIGESSGPIGAAELAQAGPVPPAEFIASLLAGIGAGRGGTSGLAGGGPAGGSPAGAGGPADPAIEGLAGASSPGVGLGEFQGRLGVLASAGTLGLSGGVAAGGVAAGGVGFAGVAEEIAGPGGVSTADGVLGGGVGFSAQNGAAVTAEGARVGGQPGTASGLGDGQPPAGASLAGLTVAAGAQLSPSAALDRQVATLPTMDALRVAGGSVAGPAADPGIQFPLNAAAIRLSEAKGQIRLATDGAGGVISAASAAASASSANIPAQWVLTGAGPGMLAGTGAEASLDELVEAGVISEADGAGAHSPDAGHKQHTSRASSTAADPIDLSAEGGRGASAADPESENGLSKRLAEGLAQRMLAAASSNNWKLQIDLKPAHLGHISIEMSMQQGQLEAVFDAGQASARQLISEGLDRLRQDLQRAGMNVAHLGLNFGTGPGTGGKPTPRGRDGQINQGAVGSVQGATTAAPGSRLKAGSSGLDVMV